MSDAHSVVVKEGISGNRILHDNAGPNALAVRSRCAGNAWTTLLTVLLGINDIGFGGFIPIEAVTADNIIIAGRRSTFGARLFDLPRPGFSLMTVAA